MPSFSEFLRIIKDAAMDFVDDQAMSLAAAISYYTIFSLPPLLVLLLMLASVAVDEQMVQEMITGQFAAMVGQDGATAVGTMIANAKRPGSGGLLATVIGLVALFVGAAGAFLALQSSLNRAWGVAPDPKSGGIKNFILKRVFSFGMVLGIAFLLLVSLAVSAVLQAFGDQLGRLLLGGLDAIFTQLLNIVISLLIITGLFAAMYKVMPDAVISWRDVAVGAFATALLFVVGKFVIGLYLGQSDPGSAFGAAGSLAIILVWIYYSAMILIFGAELTQAWATRFGSGIEPEPGAVRMVMREVVERDS